MTAKIRSRSRTRDQTALARELRRNTSKTERRLWPHLRSGQMGAPFRRQHPVGDYFADYCCVPLKLIVEVDGHEHDRERDSVRDFRLGELGFDVVRFSVQEIDENLEGVVSTIYGEVKLRRLQIEVESRER